MESFGHLISISEKEGILTIYRVFANNERELLTVVNLAEISRRDGLADFEDFAQQLGENILMDSPIARKIFNL